ncbi:MAG TPA: nuclear transport factor 2 family protein [Terriglobales bacterium]|nr:nuclear transport factor 2 family protein [Terriglobales bacterium]
MAGPAKTTIRSLVCCVLLGACSFGQNSQDDVRSQENKLTALEHLWNEAQVNRDANAIASMIADKFTDTEYDGEVSDRGKFLKDIADPQFKPVSLTIQDVKVNLYGNTAAVVTGIYHARGTYQARLYDHIGRFTDTWVYDTGKWECVASHTSLLKK